MLVAENIDVYRGSRKTLSRIDFKIFPGKLLAILGPNGAGKSTLLRVMAGEIIPNAGRVFFDGKELHHWNGIALARRRAVLPQFSFLGMPFRAIEIVLTGRSPHPRNFSRDCRIAFEAMEKTGCGHLAERGMDTLSGGEQQRVQWARVLAQIWEAPEGDHPFRCLLLDEPISSLDIQHQHAALGLARELAESGMGVAVIVHDLNLAAQYAHHILLLKDGGVVAMGTPPEVLSERVIQASFGIRSVIHTHPVDGNPCVFIPRS